jgi:DNA-binding NtrC family response regulator
MRHTVLVVADRRWVRDALVRAFDKAGFFARATASVHASLDYLCSGGLASVILYDTKRPEVACTLRRAQDANPSLFSIPMIGIWPLSDQSRSNRSGDTVSRKPIDFEALLLIVRQLCQLRSLRPPPVSQQGMVVH